MALTLQALSLLSLLLIGIFYLDFDINIIQVAILIISALFFQAIFCILFKTNIVLISALISALSLCLLLRSNSLIYVPVLASFLTIASKFYIRAHNAHIFNPTNFGLVVCIWAGWGWLDVGQWGHELLLIYLFIFAGLIIVQKAHRIGVAAAFFCTYVFVSVVRAYWLGDIMAIPLHNLQSGALLLFTFFMITDPKTTPIKLAHQIIFGASVAILSALLKFHLYLAYAPIYALFMISLCHLIYVICIAFYKKRIVEKLVRI